jgi:hypothetical protein
MEMTIVGFKTTLMTEVSSMNPDIGDLHFSDDGVLEETRNDTVEENKRATAQGIKERLGLNKGEYFLDLQEGIPYFSQVLGKGKSLVLIRSMIIKAIFSYPNIISVELLKLDLNRQTRQLSIQFSARLDSGQIVSSEDFIPLFIGQI